MASNVEFNYKPDYESWKKFGYDTVMENRLGGKYEFSLIRVECNGFQSYEIYITFNIKKGPESIKVIKTFSSYIDPEREVKFDPEERDLAIKERLKIEDMMSDLPVE